MALIGIRAVFVRPVIQFGVTLGACAACLAFRPVVSPGCARGRQVQDCLAGSVGRHRRGGSARGRLAAQSDDGRKSVSHPYRVGAGIRTAGGGRVLWFADDETDIKFKHYLSFNKFGPEDVAYWLGMRETLLPNVEMIDRVPTANNFDSLLPNRYDEVDETPEQSARCGRAPSGRRDERTLHRQPARFAAARRPAWS